MSKFIPIKLTSDPAINREILGPDMVAFLDAARATFGDVSLVEVRVRQGSEAAQRVTDLLNKHLQK